MSIQYSDGQAVEKRILDLLRATPDGQLGSTSWIARSEYGDWAVRYHLTPERSNLVRHLNWKDLDVLELGAGMGGVSRYLAEESRHLTVVEGTQARFDALSERLRDLGNWDGHVSNIQDFHTDQKFDVVCVIGVLEYSEMYIQALGGRTPHQVFLEKARSFLKPGGVLVLAIENRLGLKYWSGNGEDHTGRLFDGICGYGTQPTPRTFSRTELRRLFQSVGFQEIQEHFPFPDYKLPRSVLTREFVEAQPAASAEVACPANVEGRGMARVHYFPELLALKGLSDAGLMGEFSNSFLFVASEVAQSAILSSLLAPTKESGELAWHYSLGRPEATRTVFAQKRGEYQVVKQSISAGTHGGQPLALAEGRFLWHSSDSQPLIEKGGLRERLLRMAYYGGFKEADVELRRFLKWSVAHWRGSRAGQLQGRALDAIWTNAFRAEEQYQLIDLEWEFGSELPTSWFVFRNLCGLSFTGDLIFWDGLSHPTLAAYYESLCRELEGAADYEADLSREVEFQVAANRDPAAEAFFRATIGEAFTRSSEMQKGAVPRHPDQEQMLRLEARKTIEELRGILRRPEHRIAGKVTGILGLR